MYRIPRHAIITRLELILPSKLPINEKESIAFELYQTIIHIVMTALNDTTVKSLPDRVDFAFKSHDIGTDIQLKLFDLTLDIAEKARETFIRLGVPFGIPYKLTINENKNRILTDKIVVDYDIFSDLLYGQQKKPEKLGALIDDNPSLEILNDVYNKTEKRHC